MTLAAEACSNWWVKTEKDAYQEKNTSHYGREGAFE